MPTTLIPATLSLTLEQVRARLLGELGAVGIPNTHWPLSTGEDCLGFLTWGAGIRERSNLATALISIRAFRASAGWHEVAPADLRVGDWPLWDWDGDGEPDHATFLYSLDRTHNEITTVEANTGPKVGILDPRGVYRKTRELNSPELWGALRPAYHVEAPTTAEKKTVRTAASYLNRTLPTLYLDPVTHRTITLHRSGAGDIGKTPGDGIRGPLYRLLVQVWGATHDSSGRQVDNRSKALYGPTYKLDGIFGPRSEYVENRLTVIAKTAR